MKPDELPLGAWEKDRESLKNARAGGPGDVADLPEIARFQTRVIRLVLKREANASAEFDRPAAFVLVSAEEFEKMSVGRVVERLIHTGGRRLTGRIHFIQAAAISSVVEDFDGDDAALFARIANLGCSQHPTIIYVPQKPNSSISFYPNGCATDTGWIDISHAPGQVTTEMIQATVNAVHEKELVTPDQMSPSSAWDEPQKGRPSNNAERVIQQMVRIGLAVRFATCSIRSEQPMKEGRTDLEVVDDRTGAPGQATHHAVLELKVLRSRGQTGLPVTQKTTDDHIEDGVNQAHSYGKAKNTLNRMLCCFDMRDVEQSSEATFAHVKDRAAQLEVHLGKWYLYSSSEKYRASQASSVTA